MGVAMTPADTPSEIAEPMRVGYAATIKDINALLRAGRLEATAPPRSRHRAYRLARTQTRTQTDNSDTETP